MPSYIKKDFEPDQDTINALHKEGIFEDFLNHILPDFKEYWEDLAKQKKAKGKKESWQRTFRTWARRSFHGKQGREYEENRHKNQCYRPRFKYDLFEEVLGGMIADSENLEKPQVRRRIYRKPPIFETTKTGPAMSPEEAFAALRKQGHL